MDFYNSRKKSKTYHSSLETTDTLMNKEPTASTGHNTVHKKEATKEEDESGAKRRSHRPQ